jgi:hypothetical protein
MAAIDDLKALATADAEFVKADVDCAMLQSMATAFRSRLYRNIGFSFNEEDMADLLERMIVMKANIHSEEPT